MLDLKTIENNDKLGYYTVGQEKFHHKPSALMKATETNQFLEWHFNREVLDPFPWSQEPEVPLLELYRRRAQQIRDQYDYVRLEFSGGADSTVILYSFINNGIHLDEIVTRHTEAGAKFYPPDPFNTKPDNFISEYEYAAKPLLEWAHNHSPKTKITIHDYSDDMLAGKHDESWIMRTRDWMLPSYPFKCAIDATREHKNTLEQGKSVCVLWGVDKPKVMIKDRKWYMYFMDMQANNCSPDISNYTNITNVYFYWTPDMPEIVCKQAHLVKNWFEHPQNQPLQHLVRWPNYSISQRAAYENIIKPIIFPNWDHTTFQVGKPTSSFYCENDLWFMQNCQDFEYYRAWVAGKDYMIRTIDPKYFNYESGRPVGFTGFMSPFYCLGDASFVDSGINLPSKTW